MPAYLIAEEGPLKGLVLNLEEGETWIVGRDPDQADFILEDSTISRKHLRLRKTEEGIFLENLSRINPTLINRAKVSGRVLLKEGDRLQVGHSVFVFSLQEPAGEKTSPKKKKEAKDNYDNVFGDMEAGNTPHTPEEPPPPPRKGPKEETAAYDTIFEEREEEPSIPFHLFAETPLMLKVITGPNAGAEIGMEKGRSYTIGKDSNLSDIVFQDLSVSRTHARLFISDDGKMEIEDLGSKNGTALNGVPITEKTPVTTQDLISLGTTVFLIIDREAPQETIYSPVIVPSSENARLEEEKKEEEPAAETKEEKKDWKKQPIPTKHLIAASSFLLAFLIVFLSFFSLFKSKKVEIVRKEPIEAIKEAVSKFEGVQFSYNPASGKLFIVGHVLTALEQQELDYRISELQYITGLENNVVIDEYVWKSANDVLYENTPWKGVSVHSPKPGKFVINGFVQTNEEYAALADYLSINFPYLDRLENRVIVADTLSAQLQSILVAHGFSAVAFQTANGEVVLSGRYNEKMGKEYKHLLKKIQAIPGVTSVKDFATPTAANQAAIDLTQQFQVTGVSSHEGRGFNAILNGKIYGIGEDVQGMKITSIERNTILLEKDGVKYKIDYMQ